MRRTFFILILVLIILHILPLRFKKGLNWPSLKYREHFPEKTEIAPYIRDIDYILTWSLDEESGISQRIKEHYTLIKANERLKHL
jgi:hypothetical protein